ncbi:MAG: hypothetical protein QOD75_3022 [Blastocatellia bacterium]|jgi:hypothetical protein|nr:hypothetical protein [Blastocatellia bacterium]
MRVVRKILKWVLIVLVALFLIAQIKRPARTNPPIDQAQTIEAHTQMTPEVSSILARSCNDCHSNQTTWPWYTNVAPVSWFIVDHVDEGRQHLNFSDWGLGEPRRQRKKLEEICEEVKDGAMPLSSYTPLHPHAKLTAEDIKTLCDWTEAERKRLEGR